MKTKMFIAAFAAMFAFSVMSCGNKKAAEAPAEEAAVECAAAQGECCKADSAACEKACDKKCEK